MNDTILHLPNGDFEVFYGKDLENHSKKHRLIKLVLSEPNFCRVFPALIAHAQDYGIDPKWMFNNPAEARKLIASQCDTKRPE